MLFHKNKRRATIHKPILSPKKFTVSGIYSVSEFHAVVKYECNRSNREKTYFSIMHLKVSGDISNKSKRVCKFLNFIYKNIRDVDYLGLWDDSTFAILLPSTDYDGAKRCYEKLMNQLTQKGLVCSCEIFSYPDHWMDEKFSQEKLQQEKESGKQPYDFERVFQKKKQGIKRAADILSAFAAALFFLPLVLCTAAYIKLFSSGSMFMLERRVGYKEKEFDLISLRLFFEGDSAVGRQNYLPGSKILRLLNIEKIPYFLNVLKGDMSLVGPRPCLPSEKDSLITLYPYRFDSKPGITGLWLISSPGKLSQSKCIQLDKAYCRNRSLLLDFKILILSIPSIAYIMFSNTREHRTRSGDRPYPGNSSINSGETYQANM